MALVLGTNCYVTLAEAEAYFLTRIDTDAWDAVATVDKEKALITATRLLDDKPYIGQMTDSTQALAWPRINTSYYDSRAGVVLSVDGVTPTRLQYATFEQALHLLLNENLMDDKPQTFETIKVGPIELSDSLSDFKASPIVPVMVNTLLKPLLSTLAMGTSWWRAN